MSNQPPPRRRRIAGERRRPAATEPSGGRSDDAHGTDAPTALGASTVLDTPPEPTPTVASERAGASDPPGHDREPAGKPRSRRGGVPRPGPPDFLFGALALVGAAVIAVLLLGMPGAPVRALGLPEVPSLRDVLRGERAQVAAETAPSVAERAAEAILAYDHRSLDRDQDAAERFMTPSFAEEYATTFDKTVEPAARTYRAQVSAEVQGSSVVRASEDRVRVLLFVDQTTRSTAREQAQLALNRVEFDMVLRDGEWLVDGISSF